MSKFVRLLISTATLLAIALMLLGGGEAVGQRDKKAKVDLKKTDPLRKKEIRELRISTGTVKSFDAGSGTLFLEGNTQRFKVGPKTVIIAGEQFYTAVIKQGRIANQNVSISAMDDGLISYILVKEGSAKNTTLKYGTITGCDPKRRTLSFNYAEIKYEYSIGDAKVFVNMRTGKLTDIKSGERAHIVISGTNTLKWVFQDAWPAS